MSTRGPNAACWNSITTFWIFIAIERISRYYDYFPTYLCGTILQLLQMDTDSLYMAISAKSLDLLPKKTSDQEYIEAKKLFLSQNDWEQREPGLFKVYIINIANDISVILHACSKNGKEKE